MSRSPLEIYYNFTISEKHPIKIYEMDEKTYYNIFIERQAVDSTYFENLLLINEKVDHVDVATAYILKYQNPKQDAVAAIAAHDAFDITSTPLFGKTVVYCFTVCYPICTDYSGNDQGPHINNTSHCVASFYLCEEVCRDYYGGMGGGSGSSGSGPGSGPGGGGGSNSGTPVPTPLNNCGTCNTPPELILPVLPEDGDTPPEDPCKELKKLLKPNDSIFNDAFDQPDTIKSPKLKDIIINIAETINGVEECGVELSYSRKFNSFQSNTVLDGNASNYSISLTTGGLYYGGIHNHPLNSVPIPSFGDLIWLRNCYNLAIKFNKDKAVAFIVVKNPNGNTPATITYALKIENFDVLNSSINNVLNSYGNIPYEEKLKIISEFESQYYKNQSLNLEKLFLEKYGALGFGLYEANDNLDNFSKVILEGNIVIKQPCN